MGICSFSAYCVNTGLGTYSQYDGIYSAVGVYNTYLYYTGDTTPVSYLYYFTSVTLDDRWCLSTSLGGSCTLFGRTPCLSDCPDLDGSYFNENVCPTPTPTITPQCQLDFSSIFDCNVIPTPTPTVTITSTPTSTPTPTQSNPCPVNADVSISLFTPNPTQTPTPTPTPTPTGYCDNIIGVAYSTMLSGTVVCDQVNKYEVCQSSPPIYYYTSSGAYINGSGATVNLYYTAYVDINTTITCLKYLGVVPNVGNETSITLVAGPFNDCTICFPSPTPTPTNTLTPTITRTNTPTPSITPPQEDIRIFRSCQPNRFGQYIFIVEPAPINNGFPSTYQSAVGSVFQVNYEDSSKVIRKECFIFVGNYGGTITTIPTMLFNSLGMAGQVIISTSVDYFTSLNLVSPFIPNILFNDCTSCENYIP